MNSMKMSFILSPFTEDRWRKAVDSLTSEFFKKGTGRYQTKVFFFKKEKLYESSRPHVRTWGSYVRNIRRFKQIYGQTDITGEVQC